MTRGAKASGPREAITSGTEVASIDSLGTKVLVRASLGELFMATVSGGTAFALDVRDLDLSALWDGTVTAQSSTGLTVNEGGGFTAHFVGHDVLYDAFGSAAAGTITSISEDYNGVTTIAVTDLDVSASQFQHWVDTNDNFTALHTVFAGDDAFTGTVFDDYLEAYEGNDVLYGGAGADTLVGDGGNDHLYGQSASGGSDGADSISGGNGADYIQGNAKNDTLDGGAGSDRINGGADDDKITGGFGNDTANGNLGNDSIAGNDGNDFLRGGQGDDTIDGGTGDDVISGDKGLDKLTGGAGNDMFQFAAGSATVSAGATDIITDYQHGSDHLSIGFAPAAVLTGSVQPSLAGAQTTAQALFDGHAGDHEVAALQVGADTYLFWAGNAGGTVDSAVQLQGVSPATIAVADFI